MAGIVLNHHQWGLQKKKKKKGPICSCEKTSSSSLILLVPLCQKAITPTTTPWLQVASPFRKKIVLVIVPAFQEATRTRYGLGWWGVGRDRDLLPVLVFHSRVAGNVEDRDVLLELINLDFHILCQAPGCRHINEGLSQFIYCPPHVPYFLCNFFSIQ